MWLKEERLKRCLTQKEFAEQLGIPTRTLQNWELGVRKCPDYIVSLIKDKLTKDSRTLILEERIEVITEKLERMVASMPTDTDIYRRLKDMRDEMMEILTEIRSAGNDR